MYCMDLMSRGPRGVENIVMMSFPGLESNFETITGAKKSMEQEHASQMVAAQCQLSYRSTSGRREEDSR